MSLQCFAEVCQSFLWNSRKDWKFSPEPLLTLWWINENDNIGHQLSLLCLSFVIYCAVLSTLQDFGVFAALTEHHSLLLLLPQSTGSCMKCPLLHLKNTPGQIPEQHQIFITSYLFTFHVCPTLPPVQFEGLSLCRHLIIHYNSYAKARGA